MRLFALLMTIPLVAGCMQADPNGDLAPPHTRPITAENIRADAVVRRFTRVAEKVEPKAEEICRASPRKKCDFNIVVDTRTLNRANAYQTVDRSGQPVIIFTLPMVFEVQNDDELAFVMSHEAAHHILGHLEAQVTNAQIGAQVFGNAATRAGAGAADIRKAQAVGAEVGARRYSKEFELQADAIGAKIAQKAGYDPIRGARFFLRLPDPGDRFLGTHPSNRARINTVHAAVNGT